MIKALPATAILAIGALLAMGGCGGGGGSSSAAEDGGTGGEQTASIDGVIAVAGNPELGEILVNDLGLTIYAFQADRGGKSSCYGECEATWPPMTTTAAGQISGVSDKQAALLGTTTRKGGTLQVTYAGHPVYTYVEDGEPGEANGQGVDSFGGKWYALTPDGEEAGS